jgi:propanol-preferring alcohol dehydrogenase
MRAAVLRSPGSLQIEDRPDPLAAPGEVLLEVVACGVCRTDVQLCDGDLVAHRLPIVPGHQIVGRVRAIGPGVTGTSPGERVGVAWLASACGTCRFCTSGRENLCHDAQFTGWDRDGGFAGLVTADHRFVHPLPEFGLDDVALAPLLCGGVIGWRCLRIAGPRPGLRLGLYGFGASASLVIQLATHLGCECYVATRGERDQTRARSMGAVWAGDYGESPPVPLDAAITFAPVGSVVVDALRAVDRGGTVIVNAIHLDHIPEFDYDLLWHERAIRSVANVTRDDVRTFLEIAPQVPVVTAYDVHDLADAGRALASIKDGTVNVAAVLLP